MNSSDCFKVLELAVGVSLPELKRAYHRLARKYHPDVNPANRDAQEKFIMVSEAYQFLLRQLEQSDDGKLSAPHDEEPSTKYSESTTEGSSSNVKVRANSKNANLSTEAIALKQDIYQKLQNLYRHKHYTLAISLIESLAEKLPQDREVSKWQAIAYQKMGRELAAQKQFYKARLYLKKALKSDPRNPILWTEVERDYRYIERYTGLS
jgi:curved DNA-binding protein CbpA